MPHIAISGTDAAYELIAFDKFGNERADDPDGVLMTAHTVNQVAAEAVSDVFLMSHGWKGDLPSAQSDYDNWVRVMIQCNVDRARAHARPGYNSLIIGLHWPSLPWGDEEFGVGPVSFAVGAMPPLTALVDAYAERIADTPAVRAALQTIIATAVDNPRPPQMPAPVAEAYRVLDRESRLGNSGVGAPPGKDREEFDPEGQYDNALDDVRSFGLADGLGNLLTPLRQLSFWKMKDRARQIGEVAIHPFLRNLLAAREGLRVHLMGHSFGCIVVSAALAGPPGGTGLPRPVRSLALVQGALSLWSYCSNIPARPGRPGYFRPVIQGAAVAGPILTTRSRFDLAVGRWYPLGAGVARQVAFAVGEYPTYGGIGTFGLQGEELDLVDGALLAADATYDLKGGKIYNLECSNVICNSSGASGAHSDIAHVELAHVIWSAALAE